MSLVKPNVVKAKNTAHRKTTMDRRGVVCHGLTPFVEIGLALSDIENRTSVPRVSAVPRSLGEVYAVCVTRKKLPICIPGKYGLFRSLVGARDHPAFSPSLSCGWGPRVPPFKSTLCAQFVDTGVKRKGGDLYV